jgi:hypothetical protein
VVAQLTVDAATWWINNLDVEATVDSETPGDVEGSSDWVPFVSVQRVGGPNDNMAIDMPTLAFHCFETSQRAANELGYSVMAAARQIVGVVADGGICTQVRTLSGPSFAYTANPNLRHAVVLMQARMKAA